VKGLLQNLLLLLAAIVVCAAAVEAFFRVLDRGRGAPSPQATGPTAEHYRFNGYHPLLGYDGLPNVRGRFHGRTVTHNAQGNRGEDVELDKPAGIKRVVVIGDSQAWGYGVGDDETIPVQLARLLNEGGGARYQVLNLGVGGYGTDQAFLKYLVEGRRYAPDVVVLTVFKNDPVENARTVAWGVEKPRFYLDSGRLCLGNVPPDRAPGWPNNRLVADREPSLRIPGTAVDLARSATARFFARREWLPSLLARDDGGLREVRQYVGCVRNRESYEGDGLEILGRLVAELNRIVGAQGARLVLLLVPKTKELESPETPSYYAPLLGGFRAQGVAYVDLRRRLRADDGGAAAFLPNDPHLSAAGSRIAAQALRGCLLNQAAMCD
jgi:GDSL-like lipase/acylhydrolase family protein